MDLTEDEINSILNDWKNFAQSKVFFFRTVKSNVYDLFFEPYARDIINRSNVNVIKDEANTILAWLVTEKVPNSETVIVHFCHTSNFARNKGLMKTLFEDAGITEKTNVLYTHLTVLSEKLSVKYGWLFNPLLLLKNVNP